MIVGYNTIRGNLVIGISETLQEDKELILIKKNALALNVPNEDLKISKKHKIFYKGNMIECGDLINIEGIETIEYKGEILYNVLLEKDECMIVNNIITETLNHSNPMCILLKVKFIQNLLIQKRNNYCKK